MGNIEIGKRYFLKMRPIHTLPYVDWNYTASSDREKWVECEVINNEIRIELLPLEDGYCIERYEQLDFESLVKSGLIIEKTNDKQHVEEIIWREQLTSTVYVEHSGYVVV